VLAAAPNEKAGAADELADGAAPKENDGAPKLTGAAASVFAAGAAPGRGVSQAAHCTALSLFCTSQASHSQPLAEAASAASALGAAEEVDAAGAVAVVGAGAALNEKDGAAKPVLAGWGAAVAVVVLPNPNVTPPVDAAGAAAPNENDGAPKVAGAGAEGAASWPGRGVSHAAHLVALSLFCTSHASHSQPLLGRNEARDLLGVAVGAEAEDLLAPLPAGTVTSARAGCSLAACFSSASSFSRCCCCCCCCSFSAASSSASSCILLCAAFSARARVPAVSMPICCARACILSLLPSGRRSSARRDLPEDKGATRGSDTGAPEGAAPRDEEGAHTAKGSMPLNCASSSASGSRLPSLPLLLLPLLLLAAKGSACAEEGHIAVREGRGPTVCGCLASTERRPE